jgi:hypothetical protein
MNAEGRNCDYDKLDISVVIFRESILDREEKTYLQCMLHFSKQFELAEEKVGNNLFDMSKYIIRSMFFAVSKEATEPRVLTTIKTCIKIFVLREYLMYRRS